MIDCSRCNAPCCRKVGMVPAMKEYDRGDGTCKFLTSGSRCSVYDRRPPICNTDFMFRTVFSGRMSREEFDELNEKACRALISGELSNESDKTAGKCPEP